MNKKLFFLALILFIVALFIVHTFPDEPMFVGGSVLGILSIFLGYEALFGKEIKN